jgi:hypothetical protein
MTLEEFVRTWNLMPNVPAKRCREIANVGNTKFYQLVKDGVIRLRKNGRNSEVPVEDVFKLVRGDDQAAA